MKCKDCPNKGKCPVGSEPQNVAMDEACAALKTYCNEKMSPEQPMVWIRGWIQGRGAIV